MKECGIPTVLTYVYIFYNPRSGNRQGEQMQRYVSQFTRLKENVTVQIQTYNLLDRDEFDAGLQYLDTNFRRNKKKKDDTREQELEQEPVFLICSAGGDGSFVSILEAMNRRNIPVADANVFFTVFGFGTGNDLSQSMNWGRYIPKRDTVSFDAFAKHVYNRLRGTCRYMDIWRVDVIPRAGGYVRKAGNSKPVGGPSSRLMSNYLTLGLQGLVGVGFEGRRRTSRFFNVFEYTKQGLLRGILGRVERIDDYISYIRHRGVTFRVTKPGKRSVELIMQNLPGIWGRQMRLWDNCVWRETVLTPNVDATCSSNWTLSDISDGKLDIYSLRSRTDYIVKQVGLLSKRGDLQRWGQFSDRLEIGCTPGKTFHMMMDGEFYTLYDIEQIRVERVFQIKIIIG